MTDADRVTNQEFAIRNVLTGYCGQTLTPNVLNTIMLELVREMRYGQSAWAFQPEQLVPESEMLDEALVHLRAINAVLEPLAKGKKA